MESVREELKHIRAVLAASGHTCSDGFEAEDTADAVNWPVWCLGVSLKRLAGCGAAYFAEGWQRSSGCSLEHEICERYGIPILKD